MKRRGKISKRAIQAKDVQFYPQSPAVNWDFFLPGSRVNYQAEVGHDGLRSSVITSALCWIMRSFPEAPVVIQRRDQEEWRTELDHDLGRLLRQPNPFYGGRVLWMATVMDFCFGEAFWLKMRNGGDQVAELWWVPRALITPKWDQTDPGSFITHYDYQAGPGTPKRVETRDVVHFRFGMDPQNIRRGFSQLHAVFREVYIDDQASNFTAAILRNLGIIGVIFSPKTGTIPPEKAEKLKEYVQKNFTGDKRAQAMMFTGPMDAQLLQYNLQGFDVGPLRDISEERVCAALGIPAAVVGFGTGLQQTKVGATMREMIQLAWKAALMPMQEIMSDELDRSLLSDFPSDARLSAQSNADLFRVHFDTGKVRALWEDETQKTLRIIRLCESNIIKVSQAQRELGFPIDPAVDKYLRELPGAALNTTPQQRIPSSDPGTISGPGDTSGAEGT